MIKYTIKDKKWLKIENTKEFLEIDKLVKEKKKELQNIEEFLEWKKENIFLDYELEKDGPKYIKIRFFHTAVNKTSKQKIKEKKEQYLVDEVSKLFESDDDMWCGYASSIKEDNYEY